MEIELYTDFQKRRNSTRNPDSPGSISVSVKKNVVLKGSCSIVRPSFFVADVQGFVYCRAWGWFYFINNVSFDINGAEYIDCEIDVLGTWRQAIIESKAFIKYSTVKYNERIPDLRISTLSGNIETVTNNLLSEIGSNEDDYSYYLSVLSTSSNGTEVGVNNWILTNSEFRFVMEKFIDNTDSIWDKLNIQFTDANQCFLKCRINPISTNILHGNRTEGDTVHLGKYNTEIIGYHLSRTWFESQDFVQVDIPTDFRILDNYTACRVTLPFAGTFDINLEDLYGKKSLYFAVNGNVSTGKIKYTIYTGNPIITDSSVIVLGQFDGSFGIDIPLGSQEMQNPIGSLFSTASIAAGLLSGQPLAVGSTLALSSKAFQGMQKTTSMVGGFGGNGGWSYDRRVKVQLFKKELSEEPNNMLELYGRPLDAVCELEELIGGYVKAEGFSINVSANDWIKNEINRLVNEGIYLE